MYTHLDWKAGCIVHYLKRVNVINGTPHPDARTVLPHFHATEDLHMQHHLKPHVGVHLVRLVMCTAAVTLLSPAHQKQRPIHH
jgi:hypothetical protein